MAEREALGVEVLARLVLILGAFSGRLPRLDITERVEALEAVT